jgi:ferredoxin
MSLSAPKRKGSVIILRNEPSAKSQSAPFSRRGSGSVLRREPGSTTCSAGSKITRNAEAVSARASSGSAMVPGELRNGRNAAAAHRVTCDAKHRGSACESCRVQLDAARSPLERPSRSGATVLSARLSFDHEPLCASKLACP